MVEGLIGANFAPEVPGNTGHILDLSSTPEITRAKQPPRPGCSKGMCPRAALCELKVDDDGGGGTSRNPPFSIPRSRRRPFVHFGWGAYQRGPSYVDGVPCRVKDLCCAQAANSLARDFNSTTTDVLNGISCCVL